MSNTAGDAFADKFSSNADVSPAGGFWHHPAAEAEGTVLTPLFRHIALHVIVPVHCLVLIRLLQGRAFVTFFSVASISSPQKASGKVH